MGKDWRDFVEVSNHGHGHCRNRRRDTIACHDPNHGVTTTMAATATANVATTSLSDSRQTVAIDSAATHQMAATGSSDFYLAAPGPMDPIDDPS
ncbi:hypothetical protein C1H46_020786 [Malus baccata]|uniref:Uncharacterized protein n=1 Tax=Malus baccata TaxID=106549 RepID=A0A540M4E4_MALBA|nr:hypothetical protein C1H46_020786 [Malus baccata]